MGSNSPNSFVYNLTGRKMVTVNYNNSDDGLEVTRMRLTGGSFRAMIFLISGPRIKERVVKFIASTSRLWKGHSGSSG
ncbi:hypothetical protein RRG08_007357 [Elysia crispata]|uniref:Uncharacterized protein n=1 Tax=Elysia crispata TaxID=231223 RepID=A0AAE1AQV7_9GAST|nr:hypothetical protein RRG08_007357 [Elysia crispata]